MQQQWQHPAAADHPAYYRKYIELVPAGNLTEILYAQLKEMTGFFESLPTGKLGFRYAEGKWTVLQILQHLTDAERVFAYRILRFARKDATPLPGFEENAYADAANIDARSFAEILDEFISVRHASITLIKSLDDAMLAYAGTANNNPITVRSLCYIIAGHSFHHVNIIRERYL